MLRKTLSGTPKASCERQNSVACFTKKSEKVFGKPKKIVVSKKPHVICSAVNQDGKCSSTGKISSKTWSQSAKHVTKSELSVCTKQQKKVIFDRSHQCGDTGLTNLNSDQVGEEYDFYDSFSNISTLVSKKGKDNIKTGKLNSTQTKKTKAIEEYYKNENFQGDSGHEIKTATRKESELLPIKELPEIVKDSSDCYLESEKTSVEGKLTIAIDSDKQDTLRQLKEFREKYYFECHSSATRVTSKPDVISLEDHKCKYRFYLNDRLFPVPLNTDHNSTIRCTDCHLPYEKSRSKTNTTKVLNGTIQAKVKLGTDDKTQDITLFLPVQEPLIIREKRVEKSKQQEDVMYFGIVRLSPSGHSVFHRNLPDDSLALKYQKGYREFSAGDAAYAYQSLDKGDVIII